MNQFCFFPLLLLLFSVSTSAFIRRVSVTLFQLNSFFCLLVFSCARDFQMMAISISYTFSFDFCTMYMRLSSDWLILFSFAHLIFIRLVHSYFNRSTNALSFIFLSLQTIRSPSTSIAAAYDRHAYVVTSEIVACHECCVSDEWHFMNVLCAVVNGARVIREIAFVRTKHEVKKKITSGGIKYENRTRRRRRSKRKKSRRMMATAATATIAIDEVIAPGFSRLTAIGLSIYATFKQHWTWERAWASCAWSQSNSIGFTSTHTAEKPENQMEKRRRKWANGETNIYRQTIDDS